MEVYIMSCYFRHMKDIFEQAGIEITPASKIKINARITGWT
jgi:hypothetical protein